jgi:hypothetical protein
MDWWCGDEHSRDATSPFPRGAGRTVARQCGKYHHVRLFYYRARPEMSRPTHMTIGFSGVVGA